ncbi:MAG TPA: 2-oxo acid dehydrogenase subunit E2, partial [Caulobacter sp.]|nr:2-oxo acid dehydrogenase subunit E2 [Caulobacter sp.]
HPGSGGGGRLTLADLADLSPQGPSTVRPLSSMRRQIAQRVTESLAAPQVTAVFQADFTAVLAGRDRLRRENPETARQWTIMPFVLAACRQAMAVAPEVNGRWTPDGVEVFEHLNIGVITALGADGLVAPVVPRVDELSFAELARTLAERIDRARDRRLTGAETAGGTFTISNHGASGSLLAAPVLLYQGQGAILGLGRVASQVMVVDHGSRFEARPMAYVSLTIDHRFLDASQTNAWLRRFVATLEAWPDDDRPEALWLSEETTP